jgi:hypothetical protein
MQLGLNTPTAGASLGGVMQTRPLAALLQDQRDQAEAPAAPPTSLIDSLAGYVRQHWTLAKTAKQVDAEKRIIDALRAKRGEYAPEKLQKIRQQNGSEIYMMLFATKARQLKALLGDILLGSGEDLPVSIQPTPSPDLPPEKVQEILQAAQELVMQAEMSGIPMGMEQIRQLLRDAKDHEQSVLDQEARARCKRAERKLHDMLSEGGFIEALDAFLDDLATSPTAIIKGPVIRKTATLVWQPGVNGTSTPVTSFANRPHWERVDPLNFYPAPWATCPHDGFMIEHHRLEPTALSDLIGQEGYDSKAIREVLDTHSIGGLREWLTADSLRADVENPGVADPTNGSSLIDALQYWGSIPGKLLLQWGLDASQVPDPSKVYEAEVWLIGNWVIKAELNVDPLSKRPYFTDSFERIAGAFWGNSLYDTMRDCEDMCNAAARALANNMGIASGPQVWVMVDRTPQGEEITAMYPWKLWQVTSDPSGSTAAPIGFFQPNSNAAELMGVFDRYSLLADEVTGIPRYMTGDGMAGGAGRTASGMSMMIGNAGKTTKKTVRSLDIHVLSPLGQSGYNYIMRYVGDPDMKGDLNVIATGALSFMVKDTAQQRRIEFLRETANPFDMQIMGVDGRAAVLRETAQTLDMNTDDVVPPLSVVRTRMAQVQQAQAQQAAAAQAAQSPEGPQGRQLMDGRPATDTFQNT